MTWNTSWLVLNVTAGQLITWVGGSRHALETDASIEAIRQTAAGDTLGVSGLLLFPFGERLFLGLLDPFCFGEWSLPLPGLLLFFRLDPFESFDDGLAGVAARGDFDCFPSWLNRHSLPLLHLPCFQNLHGCFFLFFSFLSLDGDLPLSEGGLDWLLSFFGGGFSCLYAQESLVHVPLFHLTQCPFGMYPVFSPTAGAALDEEAPRVLATRSRLDSRRSLSKYYGAPIDL